MVPPGPPSGAQSSVPSLLRANSGLMGGVNQSSLSSLSNLSNSVQNQAAFNSLVSPRNQFSGNGLLANMSNVSSLMSHSFGNGGVGVGNGDPLSFSSQFHNSNGNQIGSENQQMEAVQNFQQQFSVPHSQQQNQLRGGMGNMGSVKLEPQTGDQNGPMQQLQALRSLSGVKMEPQQLQSLRGLGPVKMEHQQSDASIFLQQQQQQQQQQLLQLSRQSNQAAAAAQMNLLQQQQQRIMQLQQQQQQQQMIKSLPQQRSQLQQQLHQQSMPLRQPQVKPAAYEPGQCARRLTYYMYHQQHRPEDNNIEFWRKFVAEYFAPNAKKRWCVSLYASGRQTTGVFPQDVWHCEICNRKPGRGFETTVEVLPRLLQIKYASGTSEELLYVDMPREYQNSSGQIVLDYAKAIQESVFEQLRVVRDGQLRIVFNADLRISSWEFCASRHEELIPRRVIIPQVTQLGAVVHKYQSAAQNAPSGLSIQDTQNACNSFVASARQLAKALEVPLVNDLGYTKRYVRCLQISEVVNSMKDLIDYSRETGTGPMDSLINFPRRTSAASSGIHPQQAQQPEEQQQSMTQNSNHNDQSSVRATSAQLGVISNGIISMNNSVNALSSKTTSGVTVAGLHHQNSINSRQENQMGTANSPYGVGNAVQIPSASSSSSLPPSQLNPSSPFPSPTLSSSNNNPTATSHNTSLLNSTNSPTNISTLQQQTTQSHETDQGEGQSSVDQILHQLMSSQQNSVGSLVNEMKGINGMSPTMNGDNCLVGNGIANSTGISGMGFGSMGGFSHSASASGMRATMANNAMIMNGRIGMNHISQDPTVMNHQQHQDMGNRLLGGLGAVNGFNNLQFDWKPSP